ncbi:MAG: HEAT repeat domain-containing protein [Planctomycetota bacterium]|nr:HEAT repeat domain-containing protein [Planctomycetota bacterium]
MTGRTRSSFGAGFAWVLALAGLMLVAPRAHAQADPAEIEKLWREGVDFFLQGKFSESQQRLHKLLSMEPRKEMAARLVDEAGPRIVAEMMANPRMGAEPTYVWQLYRKYYISKLADQERMARMAARVVDPATSEDERVQLYREFAELGHYAVPVVSKYLNDANHDDFRTHARIVLARMGTQAILPLVELLGHSDVLMRENAILTITDIYPLDERAIPALKARLEDPKETDTCKRYATRALEQITGLPAAELKKASTYYYEAANRYYLERSGVADEAEQVDGYLWHLNESGGLVPVLYPFWAWNEQLAEELVLRGIDLEVDQTDFYPLAACIYAAQYQEVQDLVDVINEQPTQHYLSEEEKQTVIEWNQKLIDCRNLTDACGKYYVNAGLNKVLRDLKRYPGHPFLPRVGVFLAQRLRDLDPTGDLLPAPAPRRCPPLPRRPPPNPRS